MNKEMLFKFLDDLRESGSVNMFGAGPVLQEVFGLKRLEARMIVKDWMESFSERMKVND